MYAVFADGGRQYKVVQGQELDIDYRELSKGDQVHFDKVLALSDENGVRLGKPALEGVRLARS
jgi:large subunit ribosomal protein L21